MPCTATTKSGEPCKAKPLKDTDRCLAHSDATTRESVGFVAANGFAGRKPNPRAVDVLRARRPRRDRHPPTAHVAAPPGRLAPHKPS